ncbi:uncharacterized protein LOC111593896 [Drosophila hydei]|uniref:Uncharacterized protein LOC111593896 n=1 Tax=Drosophila hydei TaxID=7224 RepID=A0A6J1L9V9_DROHY|nr:uncharacterized protein LOC111593896 [Drosophila hydei]
MPSNQPQFRKFKDHLFKRLKRLQTRKPPPNLNRSYSAKLANSIKRRALNIQAKATPTSCRAKRNLRLQYARQYAKQQQERNQQRQSQRQNQHQQSLPKPKSYATIQRAAGSNSLLKKKTEEGEIIEEIESSDDDDCIVLEPDMAKITIDTDDDADDESPKEPISTKMDGDIGTVSRFEVDKKREHKLWENFARGTNYNSVDYATNTANPLSTNDTSCIIIDDSIVIDQSNKEDGKNLVSQHLLDDSVIFIQEDFIPLSRVNGDDLSPKRRRHMNSTEDGLRAAKTPRKTTQRMNESLFTSTERKKLADYNSNTYNPGVEENVPITHKRPIIIDGSNVAFGHGRSNVFSSEGIKYCIEYFQKMGHDVKAVIPLFRRNANKSSNPALLDQLYKDGNIVFTPCKNLPNQQAISYDDRFILQLAYERNAAVVSNDNYRDLINENAAFKKIIENRVIGYSWCDNILILPKDPYGRFGPPLAEILRC